jgi:quercetin dioxygenase-like cupin family protein
VGSATNRAHGCGCCHHPRLRGADVAGRRPAVVREVLERGLPSSAPGQTLELVRFTIAPGTTLAPHTHPGMQVVRVERGTLGYTVLRGRVRISRAGRPVRVGRPGREAIIRRGESFVEARGVAHFGRNAGREPLVLMVASLLDRNEPPSSPFD